MTRAPGSMWPVMNGRSAAADASGKIAIRHRPMPFGSLTSTAMPTSDFLAPGPAAAQPQLLAADERLIHLHRAGQQVRPGRTSIERSRPSIAQAVW